MLNVKLYGNKLEKKPLLFMGIRDVYKLQLNCKFYNRIFKKRYKCIFTVSKKSILV